MDKVKLSIGTALICIAVLTSAIAISVNNASNSNSAPESLPTATPTQAATNTPAQSSTQTPNVSLTYQETSRTEIENYTLLVLTVNATSTSSNSVTIDCSDFFLYVWIEGSDGSRGLLNMHHYDPQEHETIHLSALGESAVFRLTFEFPTKAMGFEGFVVPFSTYSLRYNGEQVPASTSP